MRGEILTDSTDARNDSRYAEPSTAWRFGLRQLLYLVFYFALAFQLLRLVKVPIVVMSIVLLVTAAIAFAVLVARRRSTQQDALVGILAVAAAREMPLAPALDAISDQLRGRYRRKVGALANDLKSGFSLADALDRGPGTLPPETEILARTGSEAGTLAGALREAGATRQGLKPGWNTVARAIDYYLFVLLVIQIISGYLIFFVIPRYMAILRDFKVPPPPLMMALNGIGRLHEEWTLLLWSFVLLDLVGMFMLLGTVVGWQSFRIPFLDRLFIPRHSALVLRSVAWFVEGGHPLTRGLELLVRWYPTEWVRIRLRRIQKDVQHGSDWVDSMVHHGLIRKADAAVLESARRAGNLPWALRATAASGERRLAYRLQAVLHVLTPLVLLGLGLLVGLLTVAYFTPLIQVIEMLT